jgi:hypothetical protein
MLKKLSLGICTLVMYSSLAWGDDLAQANNPLANFTAFNIQNYTIEEFSGNGDNLDGNQAWARFAKPFSVADTNWLFRASLPFNTFPINANNTHQSGIGDLNLFAAYMIDIGNPSVSFGVGPQITLPTASDNRLGSEKYSAGLVNVLFNAESKKLQYGYLLNWQASFAGENSRDDVNMGAFQYFAFYQLGNGTYLRTSPIWVYDFEHDTYSVPISLGIGQVLPTQDIIYNVFVEPQYSIADKGDAYPQWQLFFGLNMQFKN